MKKFKAEENVFFYGTKSEATKSHLDLHDCVNLIFILKLYYSVYTQCVPHYLLVQSVSKPDFRYNTQTSENIQNQPNFLLDFLKCEILV